MAYWKEKKELIQLHRIYIVYQLHTFFNFKIWIGAKGQRACQRSPFYTQTSGRSSEFGKRGHRFHVQRIALNYINVTLLSPTNSHTEQHPYFIYLSAVSRLQSPHLLTHALFNYLKFKVHYWRCFPLSSAIHTKGKVFCILHEIKWYFYRTYRKYILTQATISQ